MRQWIEGKGWVGQGATPSPRPRSISGPRQVPVGTNVGSESKSKDPFPDLDNLFDDETPSTEALIEMRYLSSILGDKYSPEDVIALAFGSSHAIEGSSLHAIYLTQRGMTESRQPNFESQYSKLKGMVRSEMTSPLIDILKSGVINDIMKGSGSPNYKDLGGLDGSKRILVLYTSDTTAHTFDD